MSEVGKEKKEKKLGIYKWCLSCQRNNSQPLKQHIRTDTHKRLLEEVLNKEFEKIEAMKLVMKNPMKVQEKHEEKSFRCFCCQLDIDNSQNKFVGFATIKHLAGKKHREKLEEFWGDCGVFLIKHIMKKTKSKFCIGQQEYIEFLRTIKQDNLVEEPPPLESPQLLNNIHNSNQYAHSQSYIHPLPSTTSFHSTISNGLEKAPTTNISSLGENSNGYNNRMRIWSGIMNNSVSVDANSSSVSNTNTSYVLRMTVQATGENLTSIGSFPLLSGEGNVYTGATPPWMIDSSGNVRKLTTNPRKKQTSKKLGADIVRTGRVPGKNFLPNYGGVWQMDRSRAEHREAFKLEKAWEEEKGETNSELADVTSISGDGESFEYKLPKGILGNPYSHGKLDKLFK